MMEPALFFAPPLTPPSRAAADRSFSASFFTVSFLVVPVAAFFAFFCISRPLDRAATLVVA